MADQGFFDVNISRRPAGFTDLARGLMVGQQFGAEINKDIDAAERADREKIEGAIKLHDNLKGMTYGNLDYYNQTYRPEMIKRGVPPGMLPEYKDVNEMNQGLYKNEMMKALYRQKMEGPKVMKPGDTLYHPGIEGPYGGFMSPPISPATQEKYDIARQEEAGRTSRFKEGWERKEKMAQMENAMRQDLEGLKHSFNVKEIMTRITGEKPSNRVAVQLEPGPDGKPRFGVLDKSNNNVTAVPGVIGLAGAQKAIDDENRAKAAKIAHETLKENMVDPSKPGYEQEFNKLLDITYKGLTGGYNAQQKAGSAEYQKAVEAIKQNYPEGPTRDAALRAAEQRARQRGDL